MGSVQPRDGADSLLDMFRQTVILKLFVEHWLTPSREKILN